MKWTDEAIELAMNEHGDPNSRWMLRDDAKSMARAIRDEMQAEYNQLNEDFAKTVTALEDLRRQNTGDGWVIDSRPQDS